MASFDAWSYKQRLYSFESSRADPMRMPGGLSVHVEEHRAAAVVALQLWVKVGAADERPEEAGLAYLVQRLLSQRAHAQRAGEDARFADAAGIEVGASTSFDQTVYQVTVASAAWQAGLELLVEAVRAPAFEPLELARRLDELSAELARVEAAPGRALTEALFDAAYEEHPYGLPVTGTAAGLRSHTPEAIQRFLRRWYQPGNMVLVVVGEVREAAVLELAARLFPRGAPGDHRAGRAAAAAAGARAQRAARARAPRIRSARRSSAWPGPRRRWATPTPPRSTP